MICFTMNPRKHLPSFSEYSIIADILTAKLSTIYEDVFNITDSTDEGIDYNVINSTNNNKQINN